MFSQARYPTNPIPPEELDDYLARGWFRTGQTIFTCAYLHLNEEIYRSYWLRVVLGEWEQDPFLKKLGKLNAHFTFSVQQAKITPEKEALYEKYKTGITFEPSESLQTLLFHSGDHDIYHTLEIDVYEKDKLIAVGFFDIGSNSAAGIASFYDPEYKKYSPGKFLIYQKMLYCKRQKLDYFYLGYFAPGCKAFDYKLGIAQTALEFLDLTTDQWKDIRTWDGVTTSLKECQDKLTLMQEELSRLNIESHVHDYQYFQANLVKDLQGYELFDHIQFIYLFPFDRESINPLLVYDFRDRQYHLLNCISIALLQEVQEPVNSFSAQLLKIREKIFSTREASDMAEMLVAVFPLLTKRSG